ncbi:MAG: hypothetical protein HON89_00600 [Cryomorphaceae bacterium]|jgi:hypothetical protein|nr:hypothetical protein [Cryomorphaceae bacterium]
MKLAVFTTIKPDKKNLRIQYFEILIKELRKSIPVHILWIVSQPDKFSNIEEKNQSIYSIHEFSNGLDLLQKLKPDLVLVSIRKESIQYSASLASRFLNIPLVCFTGAKIDFRKTVDLKKNRVIQLLLSNRVPTDSESQTKFLRRGRFFSYKYLFLIKTKLAVKHNFSNIIKSIFNDFFMYVFDKSLPFSTLPELYLLHHEFQIKGFTDQDLDSKKMIVIGNLLLDRINIKNHTRPNSFLEQNKIRILIVTDSLFEHGVWSFKQRSLFLQKLFKILNQDKSIDFSIKIHPVSEDIKYYKQLLSELDIQSHIFQSEDLWDLIDDYDIVLSYGYSNAHTEISFSGKKLILIKTQVQLPTMDLIEEGMLSGHVKVCKDIPELIPLIYDFKQKKIILSNDFIQEREKLFYKNDGKSAERGSQAILNLLNID